MIPPLLTIGLMLLVALICGGIAAHVAYPPSVDLSPDRDALEELGRD